MIGYFALSASFLRLISPPFGRCMFWWRRGADGVLPIRCCRGTKSRGRLSIHAFAVVCIYPDADLISNAELLLIQRRSHSTVVESGKEVPSTMRSKASTSIQRKFIAFVTPTASSILFVWNILRRCSRIGFSAVSYLILWLTRRKWVSVSLTTTPPRLWRNTVETPAI